MEIRRAPSSCFSGGLELGDFKLLQIVETSKTQSPTAPIELFTKFPDLPFELRCAIWEAAMVPRIIGIRPTRLSKRVISWNMNTPFPGAVNRNSTMEFDLCNHSDRVPAIFHVCHESRKVWRKFYKPLFQGSPCALYFNFAIDTLYFPFQRRFHYQQSIRLFFRQQKDRGLQKIRSFAYDDAFGIRDVYALDIDTDVPATLLQELSSLEELKIVVLNAGKLIIPNRDNNHRSYGLSDVGRAAVWLSRRTSSGLVPRSSVGPLSNSSGDNRFYDVTLLSSYNLIKQNAQLLWQFDVASTPADGQTPIKRLKIMILGRSCSDSRAIKDILLIR